MKCKLTKRGGCNASSFPLQPGETVCLVNSDPKLAVCLLSISLGDVCLSLQATHRSSMLCEKAIGNTGKCIFKINVTFPAEKKSDDIQIKTS